MNLSKCINGQRQLFLIGEVVRRTSVQLHPCVALERGLRVDIPSNSVDNLSAVQVLSSSTAAKTDRRHARADIVDLIAERWGGGEVGKWGREREHHQQRQAERMKMLQRHFRARHGVLTSSPLQNASRPPDAVGARREIEMGLAMSR